MAEQSSHATHSAQDATEVKLTSLVFFTVKQANAPCFNDFLNNVVALNVRRYQLSWNRQPLWAGYFNQV